VISSSPSQGGQQNASQPVTFTGCVYETSDQSNLSALHRMNDAGSAATTQSNAQGNAQSSAGTSGTAGRSESGAAGTSGTRAGAADQNGEGAIYSLAQPTAQNLKPYVGRRVEITGTVKPGRDERGADVVIHRLEPNRTVITAIDLKPAPQLVVTSIRAISGMCSSQGAGAPSTTGTGTQSPKTQPSNAQPSNR
jgi:hypothetical protein